MSSMFSLVRKGHLIKHDGWKNWDTASRSHDCKKVNFKSIVNDLIEPVPIQNGWLVSAEHLSLPLTPPFPVMWFEATVDTGLRQSGYTAAVLCFRLKTPVDFLKPEPAIAFVDAKWIVKLHLARLIENQVVPDLFVLTVGLDEDGRMIGSGPWFSKLLTDNFPQYTDLDNRTTWSAEEGIGHIVLHSLARMNCANVSLAPIGNPPKHDKREREISSVWHEIKVTSVPKVGRHIGPASDNPIEIRSHWVRGHYADYSRGCGLFGREELRKVFWIPEHKAGSPELGEVVSSYKLA